jgi:hypothetical protein
MAAINDSDPMRMPSLDRDFWELRSGEEAHRLNPKTFWIPSADERQNLRRGQAARLIFDIQVELDGDPVVQGERMWVIVSERVGETYIGILDNKPASFEPADDVYLCFGAEIPFRAEHVIDIGDPPADYVEWQLGQVPERRWPREEAV